MGISPFHELQARRLIAQGLAESAARPELTTPQDVTEHLLALQGQTYRAGIRAIALRMENGRKVETNASQADQLVHEAIAQHDIVRAWPMRGTLHFLNAPDARWVMALCSPRVERAASLRRPQLGFAEGDFERAREVLYTHLLNLEDGQVLERRDAYALFDAAGIDSSQGRGPHLLRSLGSLGEVVQGALQGHRETFQHLNRLKVEQRQVAEKQALVELGARYLNGHGPVSAKDLSWWAHLTQYDSLTALHEAENTATMTIGGQEFFIPQWQKDVTEKEIKQALDRTYYLPAFDEYLLGYSDKSFTMADSIRHEVLTKNGISWDFTVKNGTVQGRTRC